MSVLNIRGVPEHLTAAVRIAAVKAGLPIREFVIKSLSDALKVKPETKVAPSLAKLKRAAATVAEQPVGPTTAAKHAPRSGLARKARAEKKETANSKGECPLHGRRYCRLCPGYA